MSVSIRFNIDDAAAQSKLLQLKQGVTAQETKMQQVWNNVKMNYTYYSQLSSIILTNLAKAAEGTAALSAIQGLQVAQTAIVGEIAVFMSAKQAAAAFASGNIPGGIALSVISAMLQVSVAAALTAAIEGNRVTNQADEIARQMEMYNV